MKRLGYILLTVIITVIVMIMIQKNDSVIGLLEGLEKMYVNNVAVANTTGIFSMTGLLILIGTFIYKNKDMLIKDLQHIKTLDEVKELGDKVDVLTDKTNKTIEALTQVAEMVASFARGTAIPERIQDNLVNKLVEIKANLADVIISTPNIIEDAKTVIEEEVKPKISNYYQKFKDSVKE
jgi:hypothetical protein